MCVVAYGSSSTVATGVEEKWYLARIWDEKLCFGLVMLVRTEEVVFSFIGKDNDNLFFSFFSFSFLFFLPPLAGMAFSYL